MQYQIITSANRDDFESKVNAALKLGWQLQGSHQFTSIGSGNVFYTQTMVKGVLHLKEEVVVLLNTLKKDAEMALSGEWDCTTMEGKETGFEAQIYLIDKTLDKLK